MRLLAKAHEHDGRVVTGVGQAPGLRLGARHHRFGDRAPRVPVCVLAQLVEDNQVSGQATPRLTIRRFDLVALPGLEVERLLAVDLVDVLDGGGQFRHGLGDVDAAAPQLLGDVEVLGGAQRHLHAQDVHGPKAEDLRERGLAVLACDQEDHGPEPEACPGPVELERPDEGLLLPREQRDAEHVVGELNARVASTRVGGQVPQRQRVDAGRGVPVAGRVGVTERAIPFRVGHPPIEELTGVRRPVGRPCPSGAFRACHHRPSSPSWPRRPSSRG